MNRNFDRESRRALHYSTQRTKNMQSPDYIVPEPNRQPGLYIGAGDAAGHSTNSFIRQSFPRFINNDYDKFHNTWPNSVIEDCCSIDELAVWDRLLYQQRELDLMELFRQIEKLTHTEKYLAYTANVIRKQQLLNRVPILEDNRLTSDRMSPMNLYQLGGDGFTSQMQEE